MRSSHRYSRLLDIHSALGAEVLEWTPYPETMMMEAYPKKGEDMETVDGSEATVDVTEARYAGDALRERGRQFLCLNIEDLIAKPCFGVSIIY